MLNVSLTAKMLGWKEFRYLFSVPPPDKYGTSPFLLAHTHLAMPKIPSAPSVFPLLGAPQAPGNKPTHHKGGKSQGDGPMRPEEMVSQQTYTQPDPRPESNKVDRGWGELRYLFSVPPPEKYGTRLF